MYRGISSKSTLTNLITNCFDLDRSSTWSMSIVNRRWALRLVASMQEFSVQPDVISSWVSHIVVNSSNESNDVEIISTVQLDNWSLLQWGTVLTLVVFF